MQEKHVVFDVNATEKDPQMKTSKLHRRDTPHHLKNKRIAPTSLDQYDQEKEAILTAVSFHNCLMVVTCLFAKFILCLVFYLGVWIWKLKIE